MLYESTPAHIQYLKESATEPELKVIIPTSVPSDLVRAIDVTGMDEDEMVGLTQLHRQYKEYLANLFATAFKFEDWVEHSTGESINVKWRTYKVDRIVKSA